MVYRVEVAGRIFEGTDPRALIRLAVQFRKTVYHANGQFTKIRGEGQAGLENSSVFTQATGNKALRSLHKSYAKC